MKTILLAFGLLATVASTAQAHIQVFTAVLSPEVSGATGSGFVSVEYDEDGHTLFIDAIFAGLSGTTSVAHIHCCVGTAGSGTVGVAVTPSTLPGFPAGLNAGSYSTIPALDLTSNATYTGAFRANNGGTAASAEAALLAGMKNGTAYFNIHTSLFPGGEIRGFLRAVPEPQTVAMLLAGLVGLGASLRARRH